MNPEQAINVLVSAAANYHGTRQDHQQIFEAEKALRDYLNLQQQTLPGLGEK